MLKGDANTVLQEKVTETQKRAFQYFLAAYSQATRRIGRDLNQHSEVSLEQYDVLVTLEYSDDYRIRLNDLADRVLLSRSGLTRLIDKLEQKGYVIRETCQEDRRGAFAVLTPLGLQARQDTWPVIEASMIRHFAVLFDTEEETLAFIKTCRKIAFGHQPSDQPWDQDVPPCPAGSHGADMCPQALNIPPDSKV